MLLTQRDSSVPGHSQRIEKEWLHAGGLACPQSFLAGCLRSAFGGQALAALHGEHQSALPIQLWHNPQKDFEQSDMDGGRLYLSVTPWQTRDECLLWTGLGTLAINEPHQAP